MLCSSAIPPRKAFRADTLQPAGAPLVRISWLVDDVPVPAASSNVFTYVTRAGQRENRGASQCELEDTTLLVNPLMAKDALVSTHTWTVVQRRLFLPRLWPDRFYTEANTRSPRMALTHHLPVVI